MLLLVEWRKGLIFGLATALLFVTALIIVTVVMECYIANVITGNRAAAGQSVPAHLYAQFLVYAASSPGTLIVIVIAFVSWLRSHPLAKISFPAFAAVVGFFLLFVKFARYGGNSMIYFYQLLSPFLLIVAMQFIARQTDLRRWPLVALLLLDLLLLPLWAARPPAAHAQIWGEWRSLLAQNENVYAPGVLSAILREQDKPIYDAGLSDSFLILHQRRDLSAPAGAARTI